jgi:hypothetical protein
MGQFEPPTSGTGWRQASKMRFDLRPRASTSAAYPTLTPRFISADRFGNPESVTLRLGILHEVPQVMGEL